MSRGRTKYSTGSDAKRWFAGSSGPSSASADHRAGTKASSTPTATAERGAMPRDPLDNCFGVAVLTIFVVAIILLVGYSITH